MAYYLKEQWYNSLEHRVSYKRIYKSASTTIVKMIGDPKRELYPAYRQFAVIRNPVERAASIYQEMVRMGNTKLLFADWLKEIQPIFTDKHQFTQSFWIKDLTIKLFTLEHLHDCCEWIGCDYPKNKENPSEGKIRISTEAMDLIYEIYEEDYKLYESIL